jgi:hypothetical protein
MREMIIMPGPPAPDESIRGLAPLLSPGGRGRKEITMENEAFCKMAIREVVRYFNAQCDSTDKNGRISENDVFIVWLCKTLQNNKALLSTTVPDGMYYDVTYNGDKAEAYLDAYKKWKNVLINCKE